MSCYIKHDSKVLRAEFNVPCRSGTGVTWCCNGGDQCGTDGFCHFNHTVAATVTGFYLGGCTDPTFNDDGCPRHCTDYTTQDVWYNSTSKLWMCCWGSGKVDCSIPSVESFFAPAPEQILAAIATPSLISVTKSNGASTSATAAQSSQPNNPAPAAPAAPKPSASTIVSAIVIPIIAIIGILGWLLWFLKRRKLNRTAQASSLEKNLSDSYNKEFGSISNESNIQGGQTTPVAEHQLVEAPTYRDPVELDGTSRQGAISNRNQGRQRIDVRRGR